MILYRFLTRIVVFFVFLIPVNLCSQSLSKVHLSVQNGLSADSMTLSDNTNVLYKRKKPVLSFQLDEKIFTTGDVPAVRSGNNFELEFDKKVRLVLGDSESAGSDWQCKVEFENISGDTVSISNVIPFDSDNESVNITGKGPWDLARAWLFRPGYRPVRVILPDNAWEMGYTSFEAEGGISVCAIARRQQTIEGQKQRYQTLLPPKAKVYYSLYAGIFRGEWQNGLRHMFRDRYLYDLEKFDNSLYERADLAWIKESYIIILQMAWDREFFDRTTAKYTFPDLIRKGNELFENIDVWGIWPTWPRLGLDERNQWDLYRDLPGGTSQLKSFGRLARLNNTKFFIAYNPWDNSTRKEDHLRGMARLIKETEADGVVLDTQGGSSYKLQAAADSVRKGVIMFSEGMAVVKDMPGIISGRVHNAIYFSPELNLNKLIKPDFSIFRVCDVGEDIIHREIAIAFFNGYGTELNMFRPGGRDDNYREDLDFLARTTFILRQNNDTFLDKDWTPLIDTKTDNIYVNRWTSGAKSVFTVLNMKSDGMEGKLFTIKNDSRKHYVSLWNHENIVPIVENGIAYASARAEGWPVSWSGTRKEGSVDCIAELPVLLGSELKGDSIFLKAHDKNKIILWKGNPSYKTIFRELNLSKDSIVRIKDIFGYYEGKIVVQLLNNNHLLDEEIYFYKGGKPLLISSVVHTVRATGIAPEMVLVPGTEFSFDVSTAEDFIPYPEVSGITIKVDSFLIDKYPVTNAQYYEFLQSSGYRTTDTARYLRHWERGIYKQGQERYPVVFLSYEDMKAYSKWAGKRLPTQTEWQLAAQGTDKRKWPWGNEFHGTLCNNAFGKTTPVDAFSKGMSPYGVIDLVGNVWQMTNDQYFNGSYYFNIIRGGSYYKPDSSWWYIQGGPQPLDKTQILLMVSQGYDRNATVGFRCVKDIDREAFKTKSKK
jgi:gamma-glutamyl hercynylcysteine S-oxide synthase